jgi:hypothetical protein
MARFAYRIVLIIAALFVPAAVNGQQPAGVGQRVRVRTVEGVRLTGTFVELTSVDLGMRMQNGLLRVPLEQIGTFERVNGEQRRFGRNFLITTAVGAVAMGLLLGAAEGCTSGCDGPHISSDASFGAKFAGGLVLGTIISAPVGVIIGLTARSDRWEPATLGVPGASRTPLPFGPSRVALAASIRLGGRRTRP